MTDAPLGEIKPAVVPAQFFVLGPLVAGFLALFPGVFGFLASQMVGDPFPASAGDPTSPTGCSPTSSRSRSSSRSSG